MNTFLSLYSDGVGSVEIRLDPHLKPPPYAASHGSYGTFVSIQAKNPSSLQTGCAKKSKLEVQGEEGLKTKFKGRPVSFEH